MARPFIEIMNDIRDGVFAIECTKEFQDAVVSAQQTGKPSKFSITIGIRPLQGGMVQLDDLIATKLPEPERESTTYMFADADGDLTKRDPRQPKLPTMGVVRNISEPEHNTGG